MPFPLIWRSKPFGSFNVKAILGAGSRIKATLQFSLYNIRFPILDGVSNVIDPRRRASLRSIAWNHKRTGVTEDQATFGACIAADLHS